MSDELLHGADKLTPLDKVIVFTRAPTDPQYAKYGDRAAVVHPYLEGMRVGESMAGYLGRVASEAVPAGAVWSIIDISALPTEHLDYRHARVFNHKTKTFGVDMEMARKFHRDKIRAARKPLLEALDVKVTAALATGDQAAALAAETERQRLRDATAHKSITDATTIADLKKAMPL